MNIYNLKCIICPINLLSTKSEGSTFLITPLIYNSLKLGYTIENPMFRKFVIYWYKKIRFKKCFPNFNNMRAKFCNLLYVIEKISIQFRNKHRVQITNRQRTTRVRCRWLHPHEGPTDRSLYLFVFWEFKNSILWSHTDSTNSPFKIPEEDPGRGNDKGFTDFGPIIFLMLILSNE